MLFIILISVMKLWSDSLVTYLGQLMILRKGHYLGPNDQWRLSQVFYPDRIKRSTLYGFTPLSTVLLFVVSHNTTVVAYMNGEVELDRDRCVVYCNLWCAVAVASSSEWSGVAQKSWVVEGLCSAHAHCSRLPPMDVLVTHTSSPYHIMASNLFTQLEQ